MTALIEGNVKVEFEDIGEGISGDFNPEDPNDVALLRFYVSKRPADWWKGGLRAADASWEDVDDASYCTRVPVDTPEDVQHRLLRIIMDRMRDRIEHDESVKKIGEELSWIGPEWAEARRTEIR